MFYWQLANTNVVTYVDICGTDTDNTNRTKLNNACKRWMKHRATAMPSSVLKRQGEERVEERDRRQPDSGVREA